jgi:hypothetical protein
VIFCGVGTAGAYHAGVLKALGEAGIKVDVLAGHGAGAMTALSGAIDGGPRLWDPTGPWTSPSLGGAYRWRLGLRLAGFGMMAAGIVLLSPLLVLVIAAAMYAASLLCSLVNLTGAASRLIDSYRWIIEQLFVPPWIPTIVPRALVLTLLVVFGVLVVSAARALLEERSRRRVRGALWWRLVGAPLDAAEPGATMVEALWRLIRGGGPAQRTAPREIGRRYAEVLTDNLDQPGFREVLVAVHDLDARRDVVGAIMNPQWHGAGRRASVFQEPETVDLGGDQRDLTIDFLIGAMRLPVASAPHVMTFPADGYWRGESHRVCDRPELVIRLLDDLAAVGVEQVILVSPAPPPASPHSMRSRPLDLRARMGELVRSIETSTLRDAAMVAATRFAGVFVIRPDHNAIGPFDFTASYDESSDRRRTPGELVEQGYQDAYAQFIEPVVAAGDAGEMIGRRA